MEQFQHLDNLNINSSCRTCLENLNDIQHDIFAIPDFKEKFIVCTEQPAEPGDGFPTSLCDACHTKIDDFFNFKQMCISARKRLQELIDLELKPTAFELALDPNDIPTDLMMFKTETKGDLEDPVSNDVCLEFNLSADLTDIKSQCDSSSASQNEEEEDSDDDDNHSIKHDASEEENSANENSRLSSEGNNSSNHIKTPRQRRKIRNPDDPPITVQECDICKKTFKKPETYTAHMRVHQGLKPFPCNLCDSSYARRSRLKEHIKSKHEGKPKDKYPCTSPSCDKTFSSKQSLRNHVKGFHAGSDHKSRQFYICEECGKVLTSLATLKNHRYIHTGAQLPHECPQCKKRYMTKNKLKEHMNRHAGIRNYTCPHCGAKKSTNTELKTHINYHTKEKTYPCQFCDMVFNSIGNFSRHKRIVHEGIKDYQCSYCDKTFGKAETRKHHEMTHTGEKPHECDICHKKFIQSIALKKHRKIHFKGSSSTEKWDKD